MQHNRRKRAGGIACGVTLLALMLSTPASRSDEGPDTVVKMTHVDDGAFTPQIVNGIKQDSTLWQATLKFEIDTKFTCTATIVGDRVVITAAHCLPLHGQISVDVGTMSYSLNCTADPRYDSSYLTFDVALCLTSGPKETFQDIQFENLDLRVTHVRVGQRLLLLGFGCRQFPVPGGDPAPMSGYLYGGPSPVFDLARQPGGHVMTHGGATVCPGDSGGAAYAVTNLSNVGSPRAIVGLNSEYVDTNEQSLIVPLAGEVREFITDWVADKAVPVCGVTPMAVHCHTAYVQE